MSNSNIFDPQGINIYPRGRSYSKQVIQQRLVDIPGKCYANGEYELYHPPPHRPWVEALEYRASSTTSHNLSSTQKQTWTAVPLFGQLHNLIAFIKQENPRIQRPFADFYLSIEVPTIYFEIDFTCRDTAPEQDTVIQFDFRSRKYQWEIPYQHFFTVNGPGGALADRIQQAASYILHIYFITFQDRYYLVMSNLTLKSTQQTVRPVPTDLIDTGGPFIINRNALYMVPNNNHIFFDSEYNEYLLPEANNLEFLYDADSSFLLINSIYCGVTMAVTACGSYEPDYL